MTDPRNRSTRGRALTAVLLALGLLLAGCTRSPEPIQPAPTTLPAGAFSTLDEAGVEQIRASGTARLDMRTGTLEKTAVGLVQDEWGPEINTIDQGKLELTIVGPDGEITADTDRIRFNTVDTRTDFSEVTYFLTAGTLEEYVGLIRDGVERYGIDRDSAEDWIASTEADPQAGDFSITPGTSTGLVVNYDLRYDPAKTTQVIIVHVLPTTDRS